MLLKDKDDNLLSSDAIFADSDFRDKDYHKTYPTIYHLRYALTSGEVKDIRLLYLAVHHIIKNRGHFLFESQTFNASDSDAVKEKFSAINGFLEDRDYPMLRVDKLNDVLEILKDKKRGKRDKAKAVCELIGNEKNQKTIANAICGCTASLKDLYCAEEEFEDVKSFCFDKPSFDETDLPAIEKAVGSEEAELVGLLKAIYDWSVLCGIMGDCKYISEAKIRIYEKHKSDLARLKNYIRSNKPERYKEVFSHKEKTPNYAAYIGRDKKKDFAKCKKEDFYKFLKNTIKVDDPYILEEMEKGEFLPKQVSISNGVIPYQVHLQELSAILDNAEKQFPFLSKLQDGASVKEKIKLLMTFRIPYYVGPLNTQSKAAWVVKNQGYERARITPWNFEKVVDKDKSEDKFIGRMTSKCSYLVGEDVLPASSLLYSEYAFLNELNNFRVNNAKDEESRKLIIQYAKTHKKVTLKKILELLIREGKLPSGSKAEEVFSGTDGDFKTSLASFVDFTNILGEDKLETNSEMVEEIIFWITVISDKNRLEKRIRAKYGSVLTDAQIKQIKGLNYTKWGRLSKKLLTEIKSPLCADENGELLSIIDAMRVKGLNLAQLALSSEYGFDKAIREYNEEFTSDKVTYQTVHELYCSPSVKRAIWRTVCLVREIIKIEGGAPKKIFIETAREVNDESRKGKRTVSRKQQLIDLYKSVKGEERDWIQELENTPDSKFNSDKVVLYYRQMGRCMYSGRAIRLEDIFNTNVCDIDHIYPQSKIKDDSLDNRVLVYKEENAKKGDRYPIDSDIRHKMTELWTTLKKNGLISERKLERLIRKTSLTTDECADFIQRQLVFTRQSTKAAASILKQMLPDTEIVYAKAGNASAFRDENKLIKVRDLNDLHHAKDAYINIVVGNVYNTKFNHNAAVYFKNNGVDSYNLKYLYQRDIPGAWKVSDKERILKTVSKNTCRVVRMTSSGKGALFDVNPVSKKSGLVPLKSKGAISDTEQYGGYNSATTSHFMLVRSVGKKNKTMLSLEAYPLYRELQFGGSREDKLAFCHQQELKEPEILLDYVKINTLVSVDGSYAWLRGKSLSKVVLCNATQLILEDEDAALLKKVTKYIRARKELKNNGLAVSSDITAESNLLLYDKLLEKLDCGIYDGLAVKGQVPLLKEKRQAFAALSLEEQCGVLYEILHLMQCNSVSSDFTLIGGASRAGVVTINKFIQDKNIKIITQSPTGYYREVIDIKKYL